MGSKKRCWINKPLIIGIDPGINGAIAVVDIEQMRCVAVEDLPAFKKASAYRKSGEMSHLDVHKLAMIVDSYVKHTCMAIIEEPGAMPRQGLSSTYRFGHACGQCHGVLAANYLTTIPVKPNVWKPALGLSGDKSTSVDLARETFIGSKNWFRFKKHHDRAEAALLVLYATRYLSKIIAATRK